MKVKPIYLAIAIPLILFIGYELNHVFSHAFIAAKNAEAAGRLIQVDKALSLYVDDNNNTYPQAAKMPTFESQIAGYADKPLAIAESQYHRAVQFNFNLAAVKLSSIYEHPDPNCKEDQLVILYALSKGREAHSVATRFQGFSRPADLELIVGSFGCQFDRTGASLAPADYLANQDPIK